MNAERPTPQGERLEVLYRAKARAEVAAAASALAGAAFSPTGPEDPTVLVLKGVPGEADIASAGAMAGPDAQAMGLALAALGLPADSTLAVVTRASGGSPPPAEAVRAVVEAADPAIIVAVDEAAAQDAAAALGIRRLAFGRPHAEVGRVWLAVDGFAASLDDPARKKRVWAQLRSLAQVPDPPKSAGEAAG